ncbi:MAG: hypothetical protein JWO38_4390 [Gemmataceae bacterium]|nr:hypothetical protein [Gemmataceae bacterium]
MRFLPVALALLALPAASRAADPDARPAIERAVQFLAEESTEWREGRECASCHTVPMTLWAHNEAKKQGYKADDKAAAALTGWVFAKDDPAKVNPKQPERKGVTVNQTPLMLALALEAGDATDATTRDRLKAMLDLVLAGQDEDGAWRLMYVWEPHGSTADVMTTLALLALTAPNAPDLGPGGKAAREKGLKWLGAAAPSDTPQADALRLLLWKQLGRPPADTEPLVKRLAGRQSADGGWGQTRDAASDAFATGQAVYALATVRPAEPAVATGRAYLLKTQEKDGSWAMASRPGGPGGKAAKNVAPITHAGTTWAVMGLIRSSPPPGR